MFGNHGLCGLPEEGAHGKSPKCLDGNLGDFGEFCKGLRMGVLREMAEKLGHKVLPLAPYSPELNPIEKVWANIKRYLRTVLSDYARFDDALLSYFDFN